MQQGTYHNADISSVHGLVFGLIFANTVARRQTIGAITLETSTMRRCFIGFTFIAISELYRRRHLLDDFIMSFIV